MTDQSFSSSRFEIVRRRRIQRQIYCQPDHFGVAHKPNAEDHSHRDHDTQREGGGLDSEDIPQHRPRAESNKDRSTVTNRNMRQKVPRLTHEVESAIRTALRVVEISLEQLRSEERRV